ncbi:MAG: SDR family NAD(P)-dependent oxidoreductase [Actinomycetia bacterium]|nr:SDR family NAD(P)-dependent oxidoreductase [Actinomycetes bacterium]
MPQVLITGTSSGLGRGVAVRLDALGWEVLGTVRDTSTAPELSFETVALDVTDEVAVAALGREVLSRWGRLDALVNNAGHLLYGPVEELGANELRRQLDVNVVGAAAVTRAMLPALRAGRGAVVQVSSVAGQVGYPLFSAYCASKFGLEGLSEALAQEVVAQGIRVVLVEPSEFRTDISSKGSAIADRGASAVYADQWQEQDEWTEWMRSDAAPDAAVCVDAIVGAVTRSDAPPRIAVGEQTAEAVRQHARAIIAQMDASEAFLRSL